MKATCSFRKEIRSRPLNDWVKFVRRFVLKIRRGVPGVVVRRLLLVHVGLPQQGRLDGRGAKGQGPRTSR